MKKITTAISLISKPKDKRKSDEAISTLINLLPQNDQEIAKATGLKEEVIKDFKKRKNQPFSVLEQICKTYSVKMKVVRQIQDFYNNREWDRCANAATKDYYSCVVIDAGLFATGKWSSQDIAYGTGRTVSEIQNFFKAKTDYGTELLFDVLDFLELKFEFDYQETKRLFFEKFVITKDNFEEKVELMRSMLESNTVFIFDLNKHSVVSK